MSAAGILERQLNARNPRLPPPPGGSARMKASFRAREETPPFAFDLRGSRKRGPAAGQRRGGLEKNAQNWGNLSKINK